MPRPLMTCIARSIVTTSIARRIRDRLALILTVVAATMFFNRPEYGVMNTPGTSSTVNPPITQPATPPTTNPNQNR